MWTPHSVVMKTIGNAPVFVIPEWGPVDGHRTHGRLHADVVLRPAWTPREMTARSNGGGRRGGCTATRVDVHDCGRQFCVFLLTYQVSVVT